MSQDARIEEFLRRFVPSNPGPLPEPSSRRLRAWVGLAALLALISTGLLLGRSRRGASSALKPLSEGAPETVPTVAVLAAAITARSDRALLDRLETRLLPDPRRKGGALGLLGDVDRDRRRR